MQQSILQTGNLSCSSLQFKALYFTVEVTQNYGNLPEKKVSTSLSTFRYLITENHQPMPGIILVNYCWHESYEPKRQETYFRTCAPSEDSDQPALCAGWSESLLGAFLMTNVTNFLQTDDEDSDQTERRRRQIRAFLGRTWQKVGFLTVGSYFSTRTAWQNKWLKHNVYIISTQSQN